MPPKYQRSLFCNQSPSRPKLSANPVPCKSGRHSSSPTYFQCTSPTPAVRRNPLHPFDNFQGLAASSHNVNGIQDRSHRVTPTSTPERPVIPHHLPRISECPPHFLHTARTELNPSIKDMVRDVELPMHPCHETLPPWIMSFFESVQQSCFPPLTKHATSP